MPNKLTTADFISRARSVHGEMYSYDKVNYKSAHDMVTITCKTHGDFSQQAQSHMKGFGCKSCGVQQSSDKRRKTKREFISEAMRVHGDAYDYSESIYTNFNSKMIIFCKTHGVKFIQSAGNHLNGQSGCKQCRPRRIKNPVVNGFKKCGRCGSEEEASNFHSGSTICKPCAISAARKNYESKAALNKMTMLRRESRLALNNARILGLETYESPLPCGNGHTGLRFTKSQACCQCTKERQLARYDRETVKQKKKASVKRMVAKNLGINHYTTGEPCRHGHLSPRLVSTRQCVECLKLRKSDRSTKQSTKKSAEARRRANAKRRKPAARAKQRKYQSEVLFGRADYRMRVFMRSCLTRLMVFKDGNRTAKLLGYSRFDLMKRIEFQFKDGMNWDNYGEWHIDHKKPLARFIRQGITDPKIVNALSNLQPLWASDNISKGDKF